MPASDLCWWFTALTAETHGGAPTHVLGIWARNHDAAIQPDWDTTWQSVNRQWIGTEIIEIDEGRSFLWTYKGRKDGFLWLLTRGDPNEF